ncbi:MAG: hypothetical protein ACRD2W_19095 [Acidimicrobiales bacterium]
MGPYQSSLTFTLLGLLMLLRVAQKPDARAWELFAAGAAVGAAWWANPQTLIVLAPAGLFLVPRLVRHGFAVLWGIPGAATGAAPWLWYSATNDWKTLDLPGQMLHYDYAHRLGGFFTHALPQALGLRSPFEHNWLFGPVGVGLYAAAFVGFVVFALRDRRLRLPVFLALAYPFLYAASTYTWYIDQPRYVLFLMPVVALLLGGWCQSPLPAADRPVGRPAVTQRSWSGAGRPPRRAAPIANDTSLLGRAAGSPRRGWFGVATAGLVAVATLVTFPASPLPTADGARIPDTGPAHALLRDMGVTHAFADYWIAYRLTFEADERIMVTPHYLVRYQPYLDEVRAAPKPAYVTIDGSHGYRLLTDVLEKRALRYTVHRRGGWAVVVTAAKVLPEEIAEVWA